MFPYSHQMRLIWNISINPGDPDDLLDSTLSGSKGEFVVSGQDQEVTAIQPYLLITHSCENGQINPVSCWILWFLEKAPFPNKCWCHRLCSFWCSCSCCTSEDKLGLFTGNYAFITGDDNPFQVCTITDEYPIPKEFIGKSYDMHIVSLSIAGRNHKRKCIK